MDAPVLALLARAAAFPNEGSDAALRAGMTARADTIYHPVATCGMGTDALVVTDLSVCVHGIAGLRATHASVMPGMVGGNTNASIIMIAEREFDLLQGSGPGPRFP